MDKKVKKVMKVQKKPEKKADNQQDKKKPDSSTAGKKVQEKTKAKPQGKGKQDKGHGKPQVNVEKKTQGKTPEKPQNKKTAQMKGEPQDKPKKGKETVAKAVAKRGRPALVTTNTPEYNRLLKSCQDLISGTERFVIESYWNLGELVNRLKDGDRAKYGQKTVAHLAEDLDRSKSTLDKCSLFQKVFTKDELRNILHNLRWTHIIHLLSITDDKKRKQLMEKAVAEEWTTTRLAEEVGKATGGSGKVLLLQDSGFSRIQRKVVGLNSLLTDDFLKGWDAEGTENSKEAVQELESLYMRIGQILEKVRQVKTA